MKKSTRKINFILLTSLLSSCSLAPKYNAPKFDLPKTHDDEILNKYAQKEWWRMFNDPVLNELEYQAINNNLDLELAIQKVDAARAVAGISKADLWPSVNLQGNAVRSSLSSNSYMMRSFSNAMPNFELHQNDFSASGVVSYELDLFAKYRNSSKAAVHKMLATEAAKDTVFLTITSEVAKLYFSLLTLDEKIDIAKRTLDSRIETYKIYKNRRENGYSTELELLRVEAEMEAVRTVVLDLGSLRQKTETALSLLVGKSPREIVETKNKRGLKLQDINFLNIVPANIHSELLALRPDVKAAEMQLIAANANIGSARAAFFPSIKLTTGYGFESSKLSDLFDGFSNTWNFGGGIAMPIFNAGRIKYGIEAALAEYKIAEANYKKVVQTAFKETKDAVFVNAQNRAILAARTRQKNALKKSFDLASKQKESGLISLVDLLDVERNLLNAEIDQATATSNLLSAIVDLCKSLGGGWKIKK